MLRAECADPVWNESHPHAVPPRSRGPAYRPAPDKAPALNFQSVRYDQTEVIRKIDEPALLKCCETFKTNPKSYNMVKYNCSTVVAWLLQEGSRMTPGSTSGLSISDWVTNPIQRWLLKLKYFGDQIDMWTPDDVHRYALQIKSAEK